MRYWLVLLPLCAALAGCSVGHGIPGYEEGTLVLVLSGSGMGARTLVPSLQMDVDTFQIDGSGPGTAGFSETGVTSSPVIRSAIAAGLWAISVEAFNSSNILIGEGSAAVMIEPGATVQASVQVVPLSGVGTLRISISWPPGSVSDPVVSATLAQAGGAPQSIPFSVGTDSASYSTCSLSAGYYSLIVQLSDGATPEWGVFETVRILKDQTTEGTYNLTLQDLLTGG